VLYTKATPNIILLIQYYTAVFNQRQIGSIPDHLWDAISGEMCQFFRDPPVKRFWKEKVLPGSYDKDFKAFGKRCIDSD
jgi:hypothetical protein